MRACTIAVIALIAAAGCSRAPEARQYQLQGQVLGVQQERNEVLIKHEDIPGFMPGMTMPFKVQDAALLSGMQAGDLVTATLVVEEVDAYLSAITKTGNAPLDAPAAGDATPILAPGESVADAPLVNQAGAALPFSALKGHRVALTFIYTRCPLVEYCPRMVYHFRTVQQLVKSAPELADVRLLAVTLDPEFDTPAVLGPYSERAGADPERWSFVTGDPKAVGQFSSQFGLYVERDPDDAINITHNMVTVLVDAEGRLVNRITGNDWTPKQLVAELTAIPAPAH